MQVFCAVLRRQLARQLRGVKARAQHAAANRLDLRSLDKEFSGILKASFGGFFDGRVGGES